MRNILQLIASIITLTSIFALQTAYADASKGDLIIQAVDAHEEGYKNLTSSVTMTLESKNGKVKKRFLNAYTLELTPLGDKRKFVFDKPKDIKGTAVLIQSNVIEDDFQWIYLPAFKRTKRIASANKSTAFVGSEFSYEDLSSQEMEKYENNYIKTETNSDKTVDIVERIPTYANSAYSKLVVYIDQEHHRYRQVDYYDSRNNHVKTQTISDYQLYNNRYWLPSKSIMLNHKSEKKTTMLWNDIVINTTLDHNDFSLTSLKRSR